jgi:hypothetical protein
VDLSAAEVDDLIMVHGRVGQLIAEEREKRG